MKQVQKTYPTNRYLISDREKSEEEEEEEEKLLLDDWTQDDWLWYLFVVPMFLFIFCLIQQNVHFKSSLLRWSFLLHNFNVKSKSEKGTTKLNKVKQAYQLYFHCNSPSGVG